MPPRLASWESLCCQRAAGHRGSGTYPRSAQVTNEDSTTYQMTFIFVVRAIPTLAIRIMLRAVAPLLRACFEAPDTYVKGGLEIDEVLGE